MYMLFFNLDYSCQFNTFKSQINELQSLVTLENTSVHPQLKHINALLFNAISACKAVNKLSEQHTSFEQKDNFAPGKKLEHQWRFHSTKSVSGRKRKGIVLRYMHNNT